MVGELAGSLGRLAAPTIRKQNQTSLPPHPSFTSSGACGELDKEPTLIILVRLRLLHSLSFPPPLLPFYTSLQGLISVGGGRQEESHVCSERESPVKKFRLWTL